MKVVAKAILDFNGQLLILVRSKTHPNYGGQYDLPGGEVDRDKSPLAGIVREVEEETGIILSERDLKLVYEKKIASPAVHQIYEAKAGLIRPNVRLSPEHSKYLWLTRADILDKHYPLNLDPFFTDVLTYLKSLV